MAKGIRLPLPMDAVLAALKIEVQKADAEVEDVRPMQGGVKFVASGEGRVSINLFARKDGTCTAFFESGSGALAERLKSILGGDEPSPKPKANGSTAADEPWIGSDESGKGDYFGPLVVAAVRVTSEEAEDLRRLGLRDSKELSDRQIPGLAEEVRRHPHKAIVLPPEVYNKRLRDFRNLNDFLAWGHAEAIRGVLEQSPAKRILVDQFGAEHLVLSALGPLAKGREVVQRPRAESDMAVAAASVLAREEFLRALDELSQKVGMRLPKGASQQVDDVARMLVRRDGVKVLDGIAKLHFKTTAKVMSFF
ncbi:MAG: ribonuclease HIII [Planctomycetota bacterium]